MPWPTWSRVQRAASAAWAEKSAMSIRPEHPEVVVAGEADMAVLGRHLHALVREGAVADEVAQEPDPVEVLGLHGLEHRPERRQVAVHV